MKLSYNLENGEIGAFSEELETENYVIINEDIKKLILTKYVKLDLSKIVNRAAVTVNDFIEMSNTPHPPSMEERMAAIEELMLAML